MENVKLPESLPSGYRGPADFLKATLKPPLNCKVEASINEVIGLSWKHPHDPRDTAFTLLTLYDDRADTTEIIFTDMGGKHIPTLDDLSDNNFKLRVKDNKVTPDGRQRRAL